MLYEYQLSGQSSSLYDSGTQSSPFRNSSDFEDHGSLDGDDVAVELAPDSSSVSPPEFRPVLEGRLFTAHDSIVSADCEVHPTARLLYDSLPQDYRDVFKNCRMYLEKHLEFVRYLHYLSLNNLDKRNEPSERELIKCLGISVPTAEGDKKKWQCGVVGCEYKGTLQHLVSHLRKKSHIGIATFACILDCKILFHHPQDRDRHVKDETCLKSRPVEESAEPQGSTRSLRGVQDQFTAVPKPKGKSLVNRQLVRQKEYQTPAQTSAQGINDPWTRKDAHYDAKFQTPGNRGHCYSGGPSASYAPPQPFIIPVHQTHAYHQTHSNVPTTQDGHAGTHPASHAPLTPDIFRPMFILPTKNGGMHASIITNSNHVQSTTDAFQPTSNPPFTAISQPVNTEVNHPAGLIYGQPRFDLSVSTGYQDPGQSSASNLANFAGKFHRNNPPQGFYGRPQDSWQPSPHAAQNHPSRQSDGEGLQMNAQGPYNVRKPQQLYRVPATRRPH